MIAKCTLVFFSYDIMNKIVRVGKKKPKQKWNMTKINKK